MATSTLGGPGPPVGIFGKDLLGATTQKTPTPHTWCTTKPTANQHGTILQDVQKQWPFVHALPPTNRKTPTQRKSNGHMNHVWKLQTQRSEIAITMISFLFFVLSADDFDRMQ